MMWKESELKINMWYKDVKERWTFTNPSHYLYRRWQICTTINHGHSSRQYLIKFFLHLHGILLSWCNSLLKSCYFFGWSLRMLHPCFFCFNAYGSCMHMTLCKRESEHFSTFSFIQGRIESNHWFVKNVDFGPLFTIIWGELTCKNTNFLDTLLLPQNWNL